MLHAPITAHAPARPQAAPAPLTPNAYLKLRRAAAGLTIAQVAEIIAPRQADRSEATAFVALVEADGVIALKETTLELLQTAYPFDPDVYRQLSAEPVERHPRICRGCGCTTYDPCVSDGQCCGWASDSSCDRCAGDATLGRGTRA
ncbi:hypothetical protein AWL63_06295 [Sphingomonas panacis]|uniref:Uncharacterized protein n=1 Tax=Sphingomonas panacis TaxID=1560345 RepID=A0A1B3Z894_9SPHN|nr:hypothetical protein [Sphingomonas panacis]AOH83642.1 hypothetical protein AWL63_06295 [Sphingomonas panacis]